MITFFSEYKRDYNSYTLSYAPYCLMEDFGELSAIYSKGFLPYTGDSRIKKDIFYMARSLRVNLDRFVSSSENRRVSRKMEETNPSLQLLEKSNFNINSKEFIKFCVDYAQNRFSNDSMNAERLSYMLSTRVASHIFEFHAGNGDLLGYVVAAIEGDSLHYWFSFFEASYMQKLPLGKWMMWRVIQWAQDNGLQKVYLGTCYGEKSLYKVRDFKGLSFFDGAGWSEDVKLLKQLCKTDADEMSTDRFKQLDDTNAFVRGLMND